MDSGTADPQSSGQHEAGSDPHTGGRGQKTRWFTESDWNKHRKTISAMYTRDQASLKSIQTFMKKHYGLVAS